MVTDLIVCGLGNPGPKYRDTRHNLGFWTAGLLCERFGGRWRRPSDQYSMCRIEIARNSVALLEPLTFMNLSGEAVRSLIGSREGFDPSRFLVVCDDTALPLGRLRVRKKGSDGGHNGLRSIIDTMGVRDFPRLRLGVGPPPDGVDHADFVLAEFLTHEVETAQEMVARAADCVELWVLDGVETAMNRFNAFGGEEAPSGEETD
jgi:PTH1 family peptidyl-tRNA hydrolase